MSILAFDNSLISLQYIDILITPRRGPDTVSFISILLIHTGPIINSTVFHKNISNFPFILNITCLSHIQSVRMGLYVPCQITTMQLSSNSHCSDRTLLNFSVKQHGDHANVSFPTLNLFNCFFQWLF